MICDDCYHRPNCERHADENGRCSFYTKNSRIEIADNVEINPMDTETFDYDDIKKLLDEIGLDEEQRKATEK